MDYSVIHLQIPIVNIGSREFLILLRLCRAPRATDYVANRATTIKLTKMGNLFKFFIEQSSLQALHYSTHAKFRKNLGEFAQCRF